MLVVMQSHATEEQIRGVCERIESLGLKAHPIPGTIRTAIGITGNKGAVDLGVLESLPGVIECIPVSKPYKLVSRDAKEEDSVLRIPIPGGEVVVGGKKVCPGGGAVRGGNRGTVFRDCGAGEEERGEAVSRRGFIVAEDFTVQFSGAWVARIENFGEGAREVRLWDYYLRHRQREPRSCRGIRRSDSDWRAEHADFFAVEAGGAGEEAGAFKARDVGDARRFLNGRGIYILSEGNYNVMLCERGIRTFSDFSRNTLDLAVVPAVKKRSHLPILVT